VLAGVSEKGVAGDGGKTGADGFELVPGASPEPLAPTSPPGQPPLNESSFDPLMHLGVPTSVTSRIHNLKEKGEKEEGVMILEC
jgi:hypothetical protein